MSETMDGARGRSSSQAVLSKGGPGRGETACFSPQILDALPQVIMLIDRDHRIVVANRAAREAFQIGPETIPCYRLFRDQERACADCPMKGMEPDRESPVELVKGDKTYRLVLRRLQEPIEGIWYVLTSETTSSGTPDKDAVRRMKHRFNNYLAPVAGQAEIILFALKKGNYAKVEKAANQILQHAEDTTALDGLFDLEPAQESKTITYYVS